MRFVAKQENLRGTGRLHALVRIFAPRSGAQAMSEDSILWYGRPFMQMDGLISVLRAKTGSAMAASQTIKPAGYQLVKTCSLLFWLSNYTRGKRRQSHL